MNVAPRTMTETGLTFLSALAARTGHGVLLEVGPLFGSSTLAIDAGRTDKSKPIHTIDTFEAAPWVKERFGFDLSRQLFDQHTAHIPNLHVHQGFAPEVVRGKWQETIGFYFDDATHGDPGWTANYDFFAPYFAEDALICGDDFATGWPDIVSNVRRLSNAAGARLYVMGRVWVFARKNEERILAAIDRVCPRLAGLELTTWNGSDAPMTLPAAVWSSGLHTVAPLQRMALHSKAGLTGQIVTFGKGRVMQTADLDGTEIPLRGVDQIYLGANRAIKVQYCLCGPNGKTANTKAIRAGQLFDIPPDQKLVALRMSQ